MKPEYSSKLRHHHESELEQAESRQTAQTAQTDGKQFESVDELLRYDSEQNPVPEEVGERLSASIAAEPRESKPWYRRLF